MFDSKLRPCTAQYRRVIGFTLVELIIVVVIIVLIAAIVIPHLSRGAKGAAETSLRADLDVLREAIDAYAAEHAGAWPAADKKEETFIDQLTRKTDATGKVGTAPGIHVFGPYLHRIPPVPVGPNAGATGVDMKQDGKVHEDNADKGWVYNSTTGHIYANTNDLDDNGVAYNTY